MPYIAQKITKEVRECKEYKITYKECKVHYLLAVTTKDLEEWFKILEEEQYEFVWFNRNEVYFRKVYKDTDLVVVQTKFMIKTKQILKHYHNEIFIL